jgi:hypothetical protein
MHIIVSMGGSPSAAKLSGNAGIGVEIDQLITSIRIPLDEELRVLRYALPNRLGKMKVHRLAIVFALSPALAFAATSSSAVSVNDRVPLGIESFRLQPANQDFYLMASAENSVFVGLRRVTDGTKDKLVGANGKVISLYPEQVQFRLTASAREKLLDEKPFGTESKLPLDELLVKLRFRLKIFHGLAYRYVEPAFVEDIGMPRNLPYNERIYRIGFAMGKVPIEDRVVMEVLTPTGERLCKFHLDIL